MESFLVLFYILDQCYELCQENDLGGFLGVISPELWNDGKPMDMAIYNDWKTQNEGEKMDKTNIVQRIYKFLELYEEQFGYDFTQTKEIIINNLTNDMIQNAIKYAQCMKVDTLM